MIFTLRFAAMTLAVFIALAANARAENILPNGDFEKADPTNSVKLANWDRMDGLGVVWTQAPDVAHGYAIRIDTRFSEREMQEQWIKTGLTNIWSIPQPGKNPIAETYGLSLYSAAIPVKPGVAYRITFDFKGRGGAKVWVRGYGNFAGERRRRWETFVDCRGKESEWTTQSQVFHPTKFRKEVTEMKVMLFAYHPPGIYWFDNLKIEPVIEAEAK
jgi:hypothetical protein